MKIGLVSDIKRAGIYEELSLWAIGKALREQGVLPVVVQAANTNVQKPKGCLSEFAAEQFTICAADEEILEKYGIFGQMHGFVAFDKAGYDWIGTRLDEMERRNAESAENASEAEMAEDENEERTETGEVAGTEVSVVEIAQNGEKEQHIRRMLIEHPLLLANQVMLHGVSEKPEMEEAYLFADIRELTEEKCSWISRYAKHRGIERIILTDGEKTSQKRLPGMNGAVCEETGTVWTETEEISAEQYLGYVWMAAAVVTDHAAGATLALLHEKEFAVFPEQESTAVEKQRTLLETLCLTDQMINTALDTERGYAICQPEEFRNALHNLREKTRDRLNEEMNLDAGEMLVKTPVRLPVSKCTGCEACAAVCPEGAIRMEENVKGFFYPVVDPMRCNECDWCTDVCIKRGKRQLVHISEDKEQQAYVGAVRGEKGFTAYSGLWEVLVRFVREERDGVIFGSVLNEQLEPVIIGTEDAEVAQQFVEQRFLKSRSTEAFHRIKELLEEGRFVMFVGLTCECGGLRAFLKKSYTKLFVCDLMCHAVVSEKLFRKYIASIEATKEAKVREVHFGAYPAKSMQAGRAMNIELEGQKPISRKYELSQYYQMAEAWLPIREACANCSYTPVKRSGDISLGEIRDMGRGAIPEKWKNYSLITANSDKGYRVLKRLADICRLKEIDRETLIRHQFKKRVPYGKEQTDFFRRLDKQTFGELAKKK